MNTTPMFTESKVVVTELKTGRKARPMNQREFAKFSGLKGAAMKRAFRVYLDGVKKETAKSVRPMDVRSVRKVASNGTVVVTYGPKVNTTTRRRRRSAK